MLRRASASLRAGVPHGRRCQLVLAVALAALALPARRLQADQEGPQTGWVKTSANHRFLFRMVPPDWQAPGRYKGANARAGGVAYAVDSAGSLKELWRVEGWHEHEGHLADDGRHFVRVGPWATDRFHHTDLALAFYRDGRLLRAYQVRELLKDTSVAQNSVSHYAHRGYLPGLPDGIQKDGTFRFTLIDKMSYSFDITTGEIVRTSLETGQPSYEEMEEAQRLQQEEAEAKEAARLYAASPFHDEYEALFTSMPPHLEKQSVNKVAAAGVRMNLTLRKAHAVPCEISAWLPVGDSGRLGAAVPAQQLQAALEAALAHPFVARQVEKKEIRELRLLTSGDRLHDHLDELLEALEAVRPSQKFTEDELRSWAELHIQGPDPAAPPALVYFNTGTRGLVETSTLVPARRPTDSFAPADPFGSPAPSAALERQHVLWNAQGEAVERKKTDNKTSRDPFSR